MLAPRRSDACILHPVSRASPFLAPSFISHARIAWLPRPACTTCLHTGTAHFRSASHMQARTACAPLRIAHVETACTPAPYRACGDTTCACVGCFPRPLHTGAACMAP